MEKDKLTNILSTLNIFLFFLGLFGLNIVIYIANIKSIILDIIILTTFLISLYFIISAIYNIRQFVYEKRYSNIFKAILSVIFFIIILFIIDDMNFETIRGYMAYGSYSENIDNSILMQIVTLIYFVIIFISSKLKKIFDNRNSVNINSNDNYVINNKNNISIYLINNVFVTMVISAILVILFIINYSFVTSYFGEISIIFSVFIICIFFLILTISNLIILLREKSENYLFKIIYYLTYIVIIFLIFYSNKDGMFSLYIQLLFLYIIYMCLFIITKLGKTFLSIKYVKENLFITDIIIIIIAVIFVIVFAISYV